MTARLGCFVVTLTVSLAVHAAPSLKELAAIDAQVTALKKKVADKALPRVEVTMDYPNGTEGVPPIVTFFFEDAAERRVLRVCTVHVGHETWATDVAYYFGPGGEPLAYVVIGGPPPEPKSPGVVYYGAHGVELRRSVEHTFLEPKAVVSWFESLGKNLDAFARYVP